MFEMAAFEVERGAGFKNTTGEADLQQQEQMIHCTKREHTLVGTGVGTTGRLERSFKLIACSSVATISCPAFFPYWDKECQLFVPIEILLDAKFHGLVVAATIHVHTYISTCDMPVAQAVGLRF